MRHRIIGDLKTGLGNPDPVVFSNGGDLNHDFARAVLDAYLPSYDGVDFENAKNSIKIGIEPAYQYDPLFVIEIHRNKKKSSITRGKAWGPYGSQIVKTTKEYSKYKLKSKFVRFVDEWHSVLFK